MLVKNDVLSEFRNVRSYERVDLLCSLLDLCLPYELRFLGTCLEFLGKRDFYELREDERQANNVSHISRFRTLMDENTRRKLVLYVSLLKSCNSDCANCLNETLTTLCISDVSHICRSEPENAEKLLDELLLLYTIAVKHPAFNLHQKTEFAAHLSRLEEEDQRLSLILYPNEEDVSKSSRLCKPLDSIPDTPCLPKDPSSTSVEDQDSSSQVPVISQANASTCPVLTGSVYTNAVLPSSLNQASCLNPTQVMVSSVSGHQSPANTHTEAIPRIGADASPVIAVGLPSTPVSSGIVMGTGMVMSLTPNSSHCILPPSGEMGMQKGSLAHHNILAPIMGVPPESYIHMPYTGPTSWLVPPQPNLGCPSAQSSASPAMTFSKPVTPPGLNASPVPALLPMSTCKSVPVSCSSYGMAVASQSSPSVSVSTPKTATTPKENNSKLEEAEKPLSRPSSPEPASGAAPPQVLPPQVLNQGKMPSHPPHIFQSINHAVQVSNQPHQHHPFPPNLYPANHLPTQPVIQLPTPINSKSNSNPIHHYPNPISMGPAPLQPHPQSTQQVLSKPSTQWFATGDNLKEAIVREMPKYKSNLQDFTPDELLYMSDERLKEIGLSLSAVQQLRSLMSKLHCSNGINCSSEGISLNDTSGPRRKHYHATDAKASVPSMQGPPPPSTLNYGYVAPESLSSCATNSSNGGNFSKGNKRNQHLHITNQVRALQLEEDSRRPCSNSSSTSDCSSGSHSPPETPSLPLISEVPSDHQYDRGYCGKDSGAESWNSIPDDKNRDDKFHEQEHPFNERSRGTSSHQPPGIQRNSVSRSRGLSKAPPGIPTMPRGRGHPMVDKNRRDPVSSMNGMPAEMNTPPSSYPMPGATVPYSAPPVTSFLSHTPFQTMHAFHRFQPGSFLHAGAAYPFPPNGEMWNHFHQPPQPTPPFITPIVAFSPAHPPPKLSCYNCGRQGHQGADCKESTFEEITQQGQYHLDYKPYKDSRDCQDSEK